MTRGLRKRRRRSASEQRSPDTCQTEKRTKLSCLLSPPPATHLHPPPRPHDQDKFPLIANCVILLFHINSSPTGYFSLLSGKHLSTWNYYSAGASGEAQTVVNLAELWRGLCSLDGQSTGRAEGPNPQPLYWVLRRHRLTFTSLAPSWAAREKMAAIDREAEERRRRQGEVRAARRISISGRCFTGEIVRSPPWRKWDVGRKRSAAGALGSRTS